MRPGYLKWHRRCYRAWLRAPYRNGWRQCLPQGTGISLQGISTVSHCCSLHNISYTHNTDRDRDALRAARDRGRPGCLLRFFSLSLEGQPALTAFACNSPSRTRASAAAGLVGSVASFDHILIASDVLPPAVSARAALARYVSRSPLPSAMPAAFWYAAAASSNLFCCSYPAPNKL